MIYSWSSIFSLLSHGCFYRLKMQNVTPSTRGIFLPGHGMSPSLQSSGAFPSMDFWPQSLPWCGSTIVTPLSEYPEVCLSSHRSWETKLIRGELSLHLLLNVWVVSGLLGYCIRRTFCLRTEPSQGRHLEIARKAFTTHGSTLFRLLSLISPPLRQKSESLKMQGGFYIFRSKARGLKSIYYLIWNACRQSAFYLAKPSVLEHLEDEIQVDWASQVVGEPSPAWRQAIAWFSDVYFGECSTTSNKLNVDHWIAICFWTVFTGLGFQLFYWSVWKLGECIMHNLNKSLFQCFSPGWFWIRPCRQSCRVPLCFQICAPLPDFAWRPNHPSYRYSCLWYGLLLFPLASGQIARPNNRNLGGVVSYIWNLDQGERFSRNGCWGTEWVGSRTLSSCWYWNKSLGWAWLLLCFSSTLTSQSTRFGALRMRLRVVGTRPVSF